MLPGNGDRDMAAGQVNRVVHHLRQIAHRQAGGAPTDAQLLDAFLLYRDEDAFGQLVHRHGAMVMGVCRRVLGNAADADDAFQATFMVLVRKGESVVPRELVGNWLYGVAYRTALEAQGRRARRRVRERQVADMPHPAAEPSDVELWHDLRPLLDQELARLPEKYRAPIVLCDLEGRSRKETAQQLNVPEGTVSSRLNAGRKLLASRLSRRGVTVGAAAMAAVLAPAASHAAIPAVLIESTIKAALLGSAGPAVAQGLLSAQAAALTEGVLKAMLISKLKGFAAVVLTFGVLAAGLGTVAVPAGEGDGPQVAQAKKVIVIQAGVKKDAAPSDPAAKDAKKTIKVVVPGQGQGYLELSPTEPNVYYLHIQDGKVVQGAGGVRKVEVKKVEEKKATAIIVDESKGDKIVLRVEDGKVVGDPDVLKKFNIQIVPAPAEGQKYYFRVDPEKKSTVQGYRVHLDAKKAADVAGKTIVVQPLLDPKVPDEEFLRKILQQARGTPPTDLELRYFLADQDGNKRQRVIELVHGTKGGEKHRRLEEFVRGKLGKDLSPEQRQVLDRVKEFLDQQPAEAIRARTLAVPATPGQQQRYEYRLVVPSEKKE